MSYEELTVLPFGDFQTSDGYINRDADSSDRSSGMTDLESRVVPWFRPRSRDDLVDVLQYLAEAGHGADSSSPG